MNSNIWKNEEAIEPAAPNLTNVFLLNKLIELLNNEVTQLENFYKAEDYNQDFVENNPTAPDCRMIIKRMLKCLNEPN